MLKLCTGGRLRPVPTNAYAQRFFASVERAAIDSPGYPALPAAAQTSFVRPQTKSATSTYAHHRPGPMPPLALPSASMPWAEGSDRWNNEATQTMRAANSQTSADSFWRAVTMRALRGVGRAVWLPFAALGSWALKLVRKMCGAEQLAGASIIANARTDALNDAKLLIAPSRPLICPISFLPLTHAMRTSCGHTFDEEALRSWFERGHNHCPCCPQSITLSSVQSNEAIRRLAKQWLFAHGYTIDAQQAASENDGAVQTLAAQRLEQWSQQARTEAHPNPPECPISTESFTDAVTTACGHSFQRRSLMQWLGGGHANCPCCRAPVASWELLSNAALNDFASLWREVGCPETIPDPSPQLLAPSSRRFFSLQALGMPQHLQCAFSQVPLEDPVTAPCGHVFERANIVGVLRAEQCCPIDGQRVQIEALIADRQTAREVVRWQFKTLNSMSAENWDAIYFAQEFAYA